MEARNIFFFTAILYLSITSAQDVEEPPPEVTTEVSDVYETTENVTESFDDDTTVGDLSEVKTDPPIFEGKEEEPSAIEEQPFVLFPENHKNFTPSQYLGDQDFPPYHNHLNSYQQQYKNYYEQKQLYNRKPIKFEENSLKNFYVPSSEDLDSGGGKKNKYRVNHIPFPYAFEFEGGQHQASWYKPKVQASYRQPNAEHVVRGHQADVLPYYVFPHAYTHEEKFYKNEVDEHHHHVKDEKGGPWKKVFHVLTALVPLGLLLATLTPNVISINSTATTKTTRQRSEDSSYSLPFKEEDVVKLMQKYGVESLTEAQCEDRIICEMAREGGRNDAGPVEKGFWFLANQTPWDIAEKAGMNDLFKTIKTGDCEVYKCHPKATSARKSRKKLIKKHKIA